MFVKTPTIKPMSNDQLHVGHVFSLYVYTMCNIIIKLCELPLANLAEQNIYMGDN
jgi:hypothetical protein